MKLSRYVKNYMKYIRSRPIAKDKFEIIAKEINKLIKCYDCLKSENELLEFENIKLKEQIIKLQLGSKMTGIVNFAHVDDITLSHMLKLTQGKYLSPKASFELTMNLQELISMRKIMGVESKFPDSPSEVKNELIILKNEHEKNALNTN